MDRDRGGAKDDDERLRLMYDIRFRCQVAPAAASSLNSSITYPNYLSLEEAFTRMNLASQLQEPQVVGNNSRLFQQFPYIPPALSSTTFNNAVYENLDLAPFNHHYSWDKITASGDYFTSPSIRTNNNHRINSWQGSGRSQTYNGSYYGHAGRPSPIQNVLRSGNSGLSGSSWYNTSYTSLEHLRGKVVREAKDQGGHVFLAKILDGQKLEEIDLIFLEIKDHVLDLVVDQFGHRVIEKVFEVCNQEQMIQLIHSLVKTEQTFYGLCIHPQGSRTIQKLIGCVTTGEQRSLLISALRYMAVSLSKNHNGHHVIQQCLNHFPVDDAKEIDKKRLLNNLFPNMQHLVSEIAKKCVEVAMDKSGCCVVQRCLDRAQGQLKEHIIVEISSNALILSENAFGNYVVQFLLEKHIPYASSVILDRLSGNFVSLSVSKFGSNVVEKCLRECRDNGVFTVINEILQSPKFLDILTDAYGNFVAQTALDVSKGNMHHLLERRINDFKLRLLSHPFGAKVLEKSGRKNFRKQGLYTNMEVRSHRKLKFLTLSILLISGMVSALHYSNLLLFFYSCVCLVQLNSVAI